MVHIFQIPEFSILYLSNSNPQYNVGDYYLRQPVTVSVRSVMSEKKSTILCNYLLISSRSCSIHKITSTFIAAAGRVLVGKCFGKSNFYLGLDAR